MDVYGNLEALLDEHFWLTRTLTGKEGAELASNDRVAALAARIERNQAGEINEYRLRAEALGLDLDPDGDGLGCEPHER